MYETGNSATLKVFEGVPTFQRISASNMQLCIISWYFLGIFRRNVVKYVVVCQHKLVNNKAQKDW